MKHYLAGPMAGYENHNFPYFEMMAKLFRSWGLDIVSPHEIDHGHEPGSKPHSEYMRRDLKALLECEAIILLPGWTKSKGAMIEFNAAIGTGLDILFFNHVTRTLHALY